MTFTDERFRTVPEGWEVASEDRLGRALDIVRSVLDDARVVDDVATYYHRDSNYAGATFLDVGPVDPYAITSGDLLALTLLEVQAEPRPVRQLLEMTATNREIRHLLTEEALPLDADLTTATNETLTAMAHLHEAMKRALAPHEGRSSNRWVAASKLCARKRPDLFPVRDSVVCNRLELSGRRQNYEVDWQVFRHVIQDDEVRSRIDHIIDQVSGREGVNVGHVNLRLRHLDVALWMHARRGGQDT